ncbi:MAG: DUF6596 domain-containing protein [Pirellulales bacterium]
MPAGHSPSPSPPEAGGSGVEAASRELVEHFFRHEYGQLVASLTRRLGLRYWSLAEDVAQAALERALRSWSLRGIPANPTAWLYRAAYHRALDVVRRDLRFAQVALAEATEPWQAAEMSAPDAAAIEDDLLRMIFVCCDDAVPVESQLALALKTLCGFGNREIGRALLANEATIAKRIVRAKERLRETGLEPAALDDDALRRRLPRVQSVVYLLFNEGYCSTSPERLVREELCEEAVRLAWLLAEHPTTRGPCSSALLALLLFHAARLGTRIDAAGNLNRLHEQDRSQWNSDVLKAAFHWFRQATQGEVATAYHAEAWIAAEHCFAKSFAETNWDRIIAAYDLLQRLAPSPIHALNRAIAVAQRDGPAAGLAALAQIPADDAPEGYYLWHAVRADLLARAGDATASQAELKLAIELAPTHAERRLLEKRWPA